MGEQQPQLLNQVRNLIPFQLAENKVIKYELLISNVTTATHYYVIHYLLLLFSFIRTALRVFWLI